MNLQFESCNESNSFTLALGISDERADELKTIAAAAATTTNCKADCYAQIGAQIKTPQEFAATIDFAYQAFTNPLTSIVRLIKNKGECNCPRCRAKSKQKEHDQKAQNN